MDPRIRVKGQLYGELLTVARGELARQLKERHTAKPASKAEAKTDAPEDPLAGLSAHEMTQLAGE